MNKSTLHFALSSLLVLPVLAMAQASAPAGSSTDAATSASSLQAADKKFVMDAAMGGMTEVELGKLASKNAAAPAVKDFGHHMVDDHSKANDELGSLAKNKGVTPPATLDATHQKVVDKLSKLNGAAFDRAFMSQMLTDHKKTIALFNKTSASAKDGDIKTFATKTLPTLRTHLQMAEQANKVAGSEKATASAG